MRLLKAVKFSERLLFLKLTVSQNRTKPANSSNRKLFNTSFTKNSMTLKKTDWIKMKPAELEKLVIELHNEGNPPAIIGLILRDKHGIPKSKLVSKKITKMLKENSLVPETDKKVVSTKIEKLNTHIEKNKHDYPAQRSLAKNLWALKRVN